MVSTEEVDALEVCDFVTPTDPKDDQRYGMVEAISHLVHRDYAEIGHLVDVRFLLLLVELMGWMGETN